MIIDFVEDRLPARRYIHTLSRYKVPGGWYVRTIFTEMGHGAGGRNEAALFLADPEYSWETDTFRWEMLRREPRGGIYRAPAPGGWLILSTASGSAQSDDGTIYHPRLGSLVFVSDDGHRWECQIIRETGPVPGLNKEE